MARGGHKEVLESMGSDPGEIQNRQEMLDNARLMLDGNGIDQAIEAQRQRISTGAGIADSRREAEKREKDGSITITENLGPEL